MYSFYGGRPGNSFVIITTYRSIADMVKKFSLGPNYTAVHYDEYVMINTVNKNDPDNGKIYRRGYEFTNELGGAEFVGTIVGPAGKAPMIEMTTVSDVKRKHASEGFEERLTTGSYSPSGANLVPGKTANGFNDSITWACCSIRNENDEDATAYIGFTFPYTVIDYETSWIEPYIAGRYADTSSATRIDNQAHPFYEKWHINVTKGVKGDALKNFRVETANNNIEEYDGQADDINNQREVLVYDYYKYDDYQNGQPVTLYLGDYNIIKNIDLNEEGTITVSYHHDDDTVFPKALKWVDSITLNTTTGLLTVTYNHTTDKDGNPTTYTTYLDWINGATVYENGTIDFHHTHGSDTRFANILKWISGITIDQYGTLTINWNNGTDPTYFSNIIKTIDNVSLSNNGTLTIHYNNHSQDDIFDQAIQWITGVNLSGAGQLSFTFNDGTTRIMQDIIRWISNISLANNGELTITYNDGTTQYGLPTLLWLEGMSLNSSGILTASYNTGQTQNLGTLRSINSIYLDRQGNLQFTYNTGETETVSSTLQWISNVSINNGEDENQKLHITWNDGTQQDIGSPINYILNMAVNNNNHLLVRYSDPSKRGTTVYGDQSDWTDIGSITQAYDYDAGDSVTGLTWTGVGRVVDDGTNTKKIHLTINPIYFINSGVNTITVTAGTLMGKNSTDTINSLNLTTTGVATVTNSLTGLQFVIDSGIASSGAASTDFMNISITGLGMSFSIAYPQG